MDCRAVAHKAFAWGVRARLTRGVMAGALGGGRGRTQYQPSVPSLGRDVTAGCDAHDSTAAACPGGGMLAYRATLAVFMHVHTYKARERERE